MKNILLIRKSHLGDVILTEPIARHFKQKNYNVFLATDFPHVKELLKYTYYDIIEFQEIQHCSIIFDKTINLTYEATPHLSYIDAYAVSANVLLDDAIPLVNQNWDPVINSDYVLIAPNTSSWIIKMRNWGIKQFLGLKSKIEMELNIDVILLDDTYNFTQMLSLIKHCKFFIGNDSAPGIISQCFNKKSFIIFGPTNPDLVLFNANTKPIYNKSVACIGCKHLCRHTKIQCASPLCMSGLTVDYVFNFINQS